MGPSKELTPANIWGQLSRDAKLLTFFLASGHGLSQGQELIEVMSQNETMGFDREKAMAELSDTGVLDEITFIQEMRERLAKMPKPRQAIIGPLEERLKADLWPTDEEREYIRLRYQIATYEENPEQNESYDEPRYRLKPEFQEFMEEMLEDSR